ncbi:MAG TPA: hypothetical protein ENK73_04330 [Thiomicrospira sp.]|nr:hypothetical protein [Thiomicrospira sp.]
MKDALRKIINPDVVLDSTIQENGLRIIRVKEESPESKIKKLIITHVPENCFAFTLDHLTSKTDQKRLCFQQLSCYFNKSNQEGINRSCDVVLFSEYKRAYYFLMLDLKSYKIKRKEYELQLDNSELFVRYINSLIGAYYSSSLPESQTIKCQKTFVTTNKRKNSVYQASKGIVPEYLAVSVEVDHKKEARVALGKLLGL